ncbi:ferritin-like domain-containing protein [soil metagenome]
MRMSAPLFHSESLTEPRVKTLQHLFFDELANMYDAEHQFFKVLSKFAKTSTSKLLQEVILYHTEETKGHIAKLEQVFACFDRKVRAKPSETAIGLVLEADQLEARFADSPALNAALISIAQKIEHYEIAAYGCMHAWAERLGNHKAAEILSDILDEEKAADVSLTRVAHARYNDEALAECDTQQFASVGD